MLYIKINIVIVDNGKASCNIFNEYLLNQKYMHVTGIEALKLIQENNRFNNTLHKIEIPK